MSYQQTLPIWWSFIWRVTLGGMIAGGIMGAIGGLVMGLMGHADKAASAGMLLGWLVSIPVSIWSLRAALIKHGLG